MTFATAETIDLPTLETIRDRLSERVAQGALHLPVLPKAAGQILALAGDPNSDVAQLSALIHGDQALASHVLRIVNSAAYGGSQTIVSLQQAVTRIGMKLLGEIAIAVSVRGEVFHVPGFQAEIKRLWRHSLASGAWAKEIARAKRTNVECLFLCGLLHAIGKPIALRAVVELEPGIDKNSALALMDEFHGEVGAAVADKWRLPPQVRASCAYYRNRAAAAAFQKETAITWLSDRLASWVLLPGCPRDEALGQDPVLAELNLYPEEFQALLDQQESVLATIHTMDA